VLSEQVEHVMIR